MPAHELFMLPTVDNRALMFTGSFATNGASSPVAASNLGKYFKVVRSSTGLYTITPTERRWKALISITVDLQLAAAAVHWAQVGVVDLASAKQTFQIRTIDAAGAVADIAANANNRVHFQLVVQLND